MPSMEVWNGTGWHYSQRFYDVATAVYAQLPLFDNYQWRLVNLDMVWDHWAVKEIAFFTLVECDDQDRTENMIQLDPDWRFFKGNLDSPDAMFTWSVNGYLYYNSAFRTFVVLIDEFSKKAMYTRGFYGP